MKPLTNVPLHDTFKSSLLVTITIFFMLSLSACFSDNNDSPQPTVFLSGAVTDGTRLLQDVSIEVFDTNNKQLASTSTNSKGEFELKLPQGTELAVRFSAAGFTTVRSQFYSMTSHVTGLSIALQTTQMSETTIDTAFSGMALDLANKAWLAVDVLDEKLVEIDGAMVAVNPSATQGGTLLCDGTLTGGNITSALPACNPPRTGPMYLAYYDAPTNVEVTINGTESYTSSVKVGDVAYVTAFLLPPKAEGFLSITVEAGGRVTTEPDVIKCDGDTSGLAITTCESAVPHDTSITITAFPHEGNIFDDWDGCDVETTINGNPACVVTTRIQQQTLVKAEFDPR